MGKRSDRQREQLLKLAAEHFTSLGGKARAARLTAAERRAIARKGAAARWGKTTTTAKKRKRGA